MIALFNRRGRILFFPKKWANAVVRWIAGVHSPTGTIKVKNTMSPGDNGSLELDVNMDAVAAETARRMDTRPMTQDERSRFKHLLRGMIDGSSILMDDGHVFVCTDWIETIVNQLAAQAVEGYVTLNTQQRVLGQKTFQNDLAVEPDEDGNAHSISVRNASAWSSSTARTAIYGGQLSIETSGTPQIYLRGVSNGTSVNLARIYRGASGLLICAYDANGNTLPNGVLLAVAPTDVTNTNSLAIATLGWVNDKFIRKIASGEGVLFSTDGTVSIRGIGTGANQVAAGNHTHPEYENNGSSITLPSSDGILRNSSGTLSIDSKLTSLATNLDNNGKVPLSQLTGNITGHSGTCLVTIGTDGSLGHSLNDAYYALESLAAYLGTGPNTGVFPLNCIIGTGDTGEIETIVTTDGSTFQKDKMLILKSGQGEKPRWTNISASNPGNSVTALNAASGATADNTTWTADSAPNATGVVVRQQTRTYWDGTNLYGFYRDWTYDKYGRLYSISAEVQYTIDTPTVAVWS